MATAAGPAGVAVRGLTKAFGRVTAVDEMSFTAPAGKVTGFLGPNDPGRRPRCAWCSAWSGRTRVRR